jgi:hypothetical protein
LEYWKKERETVIPDEKDLNICAEDVKWDRKIIEQYEKRIKEFEVKAEGVQSPRLGAYRGHITKTKKSLDAMSGNLAYHLYWLKRFKPEVYEQVK